MALTAAACGAGGGGGRGDQKATPVSEVQSTSTSTSTSSSTTTTEAPTTTSTTTTTAPPAPAVLRPGDEGPEVEALQVRLAELGYRPGAPDGHYGAATASAVMAFQKHEGLGRDGYAGPEVMGRIGAPQGAGPQPGLPAPRIEVDLDRQIAFIFDAAGTMSIVNVSSGNGQSYRHPDGYTAVAYTPTGTYSVLHRYDGAEKAPLGTLYRPLYFKGGWAVHGSTSVPGYPASHGCVRTSYADQDFIWDAIPTGATVVLYGASPGNPGEAAPGA